MWRSTKPSKSKASPRRKEIRRTKTERQIPLWQRLNARLPFGLLGLGLLAAAAAAVIVNVGGPSVDRRVGQTLERALTARVDFEVFDQRQTHYKRGQARDTLSPNYYYLDTPLVEEIRGRLTTALTIAKTHADDPNRVRGEAEKIRVLLDDAGLKELIRVANLEDASAYQRAVDTAIGLLRTQPLVEASELASRRTPLTAVLEDRQRDVDPKTLPVGKLLVADRDSVEKVAEAVVDAFPVPLRPSMERSLERMLTTDEGVKATYRFDSALSARKAEQARQAVPDQYVQIPAGAIIADAGRITPEEFRVLQSEQRAYVEQRGTGWALGLPLSVGIGRSVLVLLAVLGVTLHHAWFRKSSTVNAGRAALTGGVLLAILLLTRLAYAGWTGLPPQLAVGPQAFATALLIFVYRKHGLVYPLSMTLALVMTLAVQGGVELFFVLFATSATLVLVLHDVRTRGQIIVGGAAAALAAGALTVGAGLMQQQTLPFVLWQAAWATGGTLAAAFLVEGVLPVIERAFGLSTSLTLLEWCDASKPLLRMMAAEAAGTYNHSLLVGALAESAADAVGANGLLCRAGAYYHDIGKSNKPEYFVENQAMHPNRHERLSPAMSLLIIIGHVKDGIEMAKEYGLPVSLRPFIAEHHGTTLVEYFYHAASKSRKPDDPAVSDTEFRYPGPKPQSRETAIVMVCDGVEGAVRAMSEPTPGRIQDVVEAIVQKRLDDGQFDECELTFRDIATIRASLIKSLCAIYHSRITYPSASETPAQDARTVGA